MNNVELAKFLQRFPQTAPVKVKITDGPGPPRLVEIDSIEMGFDRTPMTLTQSNTAWSDMIAEKIEVVLVLGEGKSIK